MTNEIPAPADLVEAFACYYEIPETGVWRLYRHRYSDPEHVARGWTETPLYLAPQPDPRDAEIERLREALEAFLNDGPCWDFGEWFESRCKQARAALAKSEPKP